MDIPKNLTDLTNLAKGVLGQSDVTEKVADGVDGALEKVEGLADKVGLGDKLDDAVNMVEEKTGFDVDQDGDVAK